MLTEIGHKLGVKVFVGKREQSEKYGNKSLSELQDFTDISFLKLDKDKYDRISMIDMLWIDKNNIKYIIEVENTTKFISGIQRASSADIAIPKLMVVPDNTEKKNF